MWSKPQHPQVIDQRTHEFSSASGHFLRAAAAVATVAAVVAGVPVVAGVAVLTRGGLGVGWPHCSFCAAFLPPFLPFSVSLSVPTGSLQPSFRRGPVRPLA